MATQKQLDARARFNQSSNLIFQHKRRNSKLTSSQRQDVISRFRDGEDPKDLALEYGITASYVRQLGTWA